MSDIDDAQQAAAESVAAPGDWLTGAQRLAVWREVRASRTDVLDAARRRALSPNAVVGRHDATDELSASAMDVVHRTASDPGRLTRAWADEHIEALGEETYTELIGVTAIVETIDKFRAAMGLDEWALGDPVAGEPTRVRPDGVGDVGAWISQTTGPTVANVSRTLSLVPTTNHVWRQLVTTHYSRGPEFLNMRWDLPLTRPQTELVASRTTALNECFY